MKYLFYLLCFSYTLNAALPPAWEGIHEIRSILDDQKLADYLNSADIIERIERSTSGWTISTNHSEIEVEMSPVPQAMPGPAEYKFTFKKMPK